MSGRISLKERFAAATARRTEAEAAAAAGALAVPPSPTAPPAVPALTQPQLGQQQQQSEQQPTQQQQSEQQPTQQQQQQQPPLPAQPPREQHPTEPCDASRLPGGSQRDEGKLARLRRLQQQASQRAPPAASQEVAPALSQRPARRHIFVGGQIILLEDEDAGAAVQAASQQQPTQQQQSAGAPLSQQRQPGAPPSQQQMGLSLPHQHQASWEGGGGAGDGLPIDRSAARAAVVLGADVDDFEHDPTDALRQAAQRASGRGGGEAQRGAAPAAAPAPAAAGPQVDDALDDLFPAAKPRPQRKPGRRGSAGTPAGAAMRAKKRQAEAAAAEAEEEGEEGGARQRKARAGVVGASRATRKGAAPKRMRRESPKATEPEPGLAGSEEEEEGGDELADDLLLPPLAQQPPPRQQQGGRGSPAAGSGAAAAAQQEGLDREQGAPQAHRAAANAASVGPEVELTIRVDMNGNDWPEDDPGMPYLELGVPGNINKYLRDYQRDGIRFFLRQYARGTGGILADDMGLGKTVQAVGLAAALLGKTGGEEDAYLPELQPLHRIQPPAAPGDVDEDGEPLPTIEDDEYAPDYNVGSPVLIVAPTSVLTNWEREFDMWGRFRVVTCVGGKRDSAIAAIMAGKAEVMIVSYNTMRSLKDDLLCVPWHAVILDEAHNLKNASTATYQVANRLPTPLRYGLTGTPFQNDYTEVHTPAGPEMHALLDLVAPGCLGTRKEFTDSIALPIMQGQKYTASELEILLGEEAREDVRRVLSGYVLRRTKQLIAHQLPQKMDYVVFCELSPAQLAAYKRVLETSADVQLLLHKDDPCPCGSGEKSWRCCGWKVDFDQGGVLWPIYHECECDNPYDELTNPKGCKYHKPDGCWHQTPKGGFRRMCPFCLVLPVCSILRKISNHLEMVKAAWEDREGNPPKFEKDRRVAEMVIGTDVDLLGGYVTTQSFERLSDVATCGKMKVLKMLLQMWIREPDNKVLLFSNSVRLLSILRAMLTSEGYDFLMLDGSTPQKDRQALCDRFNNPQSGTFLFLISTLAGGTGLNLTAANKVIIFDPSWNPASDLQAQDRAFRIGQKNNVSVYRFVAAGTLEEMVYTRQVYKQQQSNVVIEGALQPRMYKGAKTGKKEDFGELWGMFNLLQLNAQKVLTIDLLAAQRSRTREGYRIQEFDAEGLAGAAGGAGAAAPGGAGGAHLHVDDAGEAGLEALVQAEVERELGREAGEGEGGAEGGDGGGGGDGGAGPSQRGGGGGGGRGGRALLEAEQAAQERWEGHRQETDALGQVGIAGLMQHNLALKADAGEQAKQEAARKAAAASRQEHAAGMAAAAAAAAPGQLRTERAVRAEAARAARRGAGSSHVKVVKLSLLESLAELLGLEPAAAARQLLGMTPEERTQLRRRLAEADAQPPLGGSSGNGSSSSEGGDSGDEGGSNGGGGWGGGGANGYGGGKTGKAAKYVDDDY